MGPVLGTSLGTLDLDTVRLKYKVQDYVSPKDLEALEASHTWWDSTPDEMQPLAEAGTVSFLSWGVLPTLQGEQCTGTKKRFLRSR